ncbi:MAG TPA: hypothetical protein VGO97_00015 [Solirubrobacterales bacterium]|jgi:hypothetical protein|nr:hypothetical protein [Solirubrobacterales bacterium]
MGDIQISKPVLIALVAAVLAGGFLLYNNSQTESIPPSPPLGPLGGATGTTGPSGATNRAGATGQTGPTGPSRAEKRAAAAKKRRAALRAKAKAAGIPLDVYLARRAGKVIIIFFWEPKGKDDMRVNDAVNSVAASRGNVKVFRERIRYKSRYDGIAQAAQVTQTPAVVLLYRNKADIFQGYIDKDTLNEKVARLIRR